MAHLEGRASAGPRHPGRGGADPARVGRDRGGAVMPLRARTQPGGPLLRRGRAHRGAARHRDDLRPTSPRSGSGRPCRAPMTTLSAWPSARTDGCCATWSPQTRRAGAAPDPGRGSPTTTPGCCSSCSTPASGFRSTSTPTAPSRPPTWPAPTARPRRGTSSTSTRGRPSTSAGPRTSTPTSWYAGSTPRTATGCSRGCTGSRSGRGTASWCPPDRSHAIGAGVFVAEAQEPTDFSILLEWSVTTSTREDSHLGLGFERALCAVSHRALAPAALDAPRPDGRRPRGQRPAVLPPCRGRPLLPAAPRHARRTGWPRASRCCWCLEGAALITSDAGEEVRVAQGEAWAVPHRIRGLVGLRAGRAARGPARCRLAR